MAVHVPLSIEAQIECRLELLSVNNLFSPADGRPIMSPTQDLILGLYYLTKEKLGGANEGKIFSNPQEAIIAFNDGLLTLHERIKVRIFDPVWGEEKPSLVISESAVEAEQKEESATLGSRDPVGLLATRRRRAEVDIDAAVPVLPEVSLARVDARLRQPQRHYSSPGSK